MKPMKKFFPDTSLFLLLFAFFFLLAPLGGENKEEIRIQAYVHPEKGTTGSPLQFIIEVESKGNNDFDEPELPSSINGFQIAGRSISTQMAYTSEGRRLVVSYILILIPVKTGKQKLPSVTMDAGGKKLTTREIIIEITKGEKSPPKRTHPRRSYPPERNVPRPDNDGIFI